VIILFWTLRVAIAVIGLALLGITWRAALVVLACLLLDFALVIAMGIPGTGLLAPSVFLLALGMASGVILAIGNSTAEPHGLPLLAAILLVILRLSWATDTEGLRSLVLAWRLHAVAVLTMPAGLYIGGATVRAVRHRWRRTSISDDRADAGTGSAR
jgi:hypothetical protein